VGTAVITGSNKGIGLALCHELKSRGHQVVATCRHASAELMQTGVEVVEGIDVTDSAATDRLRAHLGERPVDLLLNNAGITARESFDVLDVNMIREQFEVNSLGPIRVTKALIDNLRAGSKVVILGSRAGSLTAIESGGRYAYRMSKAAVNMASVILAHDLRPREIAVLLLYPGYVATEMMNFEGIAPTTSAVQILDRIDALGMQQSGMFCHVNGERLSW
jgi:NAD(P)-dependent dehydrogenase (short-subunit alcohol dehydrogenase family)